MNYTQSSLAQATGLSRQFVTDVENGRKNLSADSLYKLSRILLSSTDYLLTGRTPLDSPNGSLVELLLGVDPEDTGNVAAILRAHISSVNRYKHGSQ